MGLDSNYKKNRRIVQNNNFYTPQQVKCNSSRRRCKKGTVVNCNPLCGPNNNKVAYKILKYNSSVYSQTYFMLRIHFVFDTNSYI